MARQRISYVPLEKMDAKMRAEMERCAREGTPRPESSAVRAHVKACFWFFADSWNNVFRNGILDHAVKELCRVYVSRSVICEFCGNQRSIKGAEQGLQETHYDDLINFEKLGAEAHETNNPLRDSVTALVPFAIVTLKNEKGEEKVVRFWPIEQIEQPGTGKIFNIRYLTDCSWGPFMLTQHHVFGPIFRGYSHFFGEHRNSNPIVQ